MKYHYVYRITNIKLNKHYYGVRSAINNIPEKDLGIIYFSSSSDKAFIKDQHVNPQNYKYKIVNKFNTREKAYNCEIKLHHKFNVSCNKSFYNKANSTSSCWDRTGVKQSQESILKMINTKKKNGTINHTSKTCEKISNTMKGKRPNNYGKPRSLEAIAKTSLENTGKKRTKVQRENISNSLKGRKLSDAHKLSVSKGRKGKLCENENPMAAKINIYNEMNDLMFICDGNFKTICKEHNLPTMSLIRSYLNNGSLLYKSNQAKTKAKTNGNEKFIGWYAIKL